MTAISRVGMVCAPEADEDPNPHTLDCEARIRGDVTNGLCDCGADGEGDEIGPHVCCFVGVQGDGESYDECETCGRRMYGDLGGEGG